MHKPAQLSAQLVRKEPASLAEEPSLEDGTVPHVARQPSQPVSQGDEASAELDSGAAAIMGRQKSSTARQTQPVLTAQPQRSSW